MTTALEDEEHFRTNPFKPKMSFSFSQENLVIKRKDLHNAAHLVGTIPEVWYLILDNRIIHSAAKSSERKNVSRKGSGFSLHSFALS